MATIARCIALESGCSTRRKRNHSTRRIVPPSLPTEGELHALSKLRFVRSAIGAAAVAYPGLSTNGPCLATETITGSAGICVDVNDEKIYERERLRELGGRTVFQNQAPVAETFRSSAIRCVAKRNQRVDADLRAEDPIEEIRYHGLVGHAFCDQSEFWHRQKLSGSPPR